MDIIKASQIFVLNADRNFEFSHTLVIYRSEGRIYSAKSLHRKYTAGPLEDVQLIPPEAYQPLAPPNSTTAHNDRSTYTKTPNLSAFDGADNLARQVLRELETCESIHRSPHTNLATYYGCSLAGNRIAELCFKRYPADLMTVVNPGHLNKSMLIEAAGRRSAREQAVGFLGAMEDGIRHLHRLGIIHNDVNPANILISGDGVPVVCDFDSSAGTGDDISLVKRTQGWYDPAVCVAQESNDFDALLEIRIWLTGSSPGEYRFRE
jgi:serine/threonine protein kinase